MKILVTGGRDYRDRQRLFATLDEISAETPVTKVVHGGARGADALAGEWATSRNVDQTVYPAEWDAYGRSAGPIRNRQMLRDERPDLVVAFPGGAGTAHMVSIAKKAGVEVRTVHLNRGEIPTRTASA